MNGILVTAKEELGVEEYDVHQKFEFLDSKLSKGVIEES
jgi:hypothetical protein